MGCVPGRADLMRPISLVCKVKSANGSPAIKLSDDYAKATGPAEEIERYRRVFGSAGMDTPPAIVSSSDTSRNIHMTRNKLLLAFYHPIDVNVPHPALNPIARHAGKKWVKMCIF